jgi:putative ABC transport system permease protein
VNPFVLAIKSLRNRKFTAGLTVVSIALSVTLLLGVERIRSEAQTSFTNTIAGTDLIVGARTSPVQLLLASVFGLGNATNNIDWESYEKISKHPGISWSIPISLGDTHDGYRVLGTTGAYFDHFQYGRKQALQMRAGTWFDSENGAVLGAEVAEKLGYRVGSGIIVSHGSGEISFIQHDSHPFQVAGILERTGTPVDRTVFVGLSGIDAIHAGMEAADDHGHDPLAAHEEMDHHHGKEPYGTALHNVVHGGHRLHGHEPRAITAFYIGLKSRSAALSVQRMINEYKGEPLTAVLPAVALQELWGIVGIVEKALLAVSGFVVVVGLSGMLVAIMTSLNERRREMAILRSVGARPLHVFSLIVGEAGFVTLTGIAVGTTLLYTFLLAAQPLIAARFGLFIGIGGLSAYELVLMGVVCLAGFCIGIIPGYRIYRFSLADGMTIRI